MGKAKMFRFPLNGSGRSDAFLYLPCSYDGNATRGRQWRRTVRRETLQSIAEEKKRKPGIPCMCQVLGMTTTNDKLSMTD